MRVILFYRLQSAVDCWSYVCCRAYVGLVSAPLPQLISTADLQQQTSAPR